MASSSGALPKPPHFLVVVAIGIAAIGALSAAPGDEDEVRAYVQEFFDRWTRADEPEDIASYYAENATHINPQGEWVRTRTRLVSYFEPLVVARGEDFSARFEIESVSFIAERVALVDGTIAIHGMPGREGELDERFAFVMKKTSAGWKIAASRVMFPEER